MTDEQQLHMNFDLPPELRPGVYAEIAAVWHTKDGFTIDFLAPVMPATTTDEGGPAQQQATVVSRVRLPVQVIFQVARAISENVSMYEQTYGAIPTGGPNHPPSEVD
ncbi:MAG: DUF3467 domain-containing protein [Actinomycetota bacterium]|nr:DUF3467 domain-containing protein [Actinomycetota bacterium]